MPEVRPTWEQEMLELMRSGNECIWMISKQINEFSRTNAELLTANQHLLEQNNDLLDRNNRFMEVNCELGRQLTLLSQYEMGMLAMLAGVLLAFVFVYGLKLR